MTKVNLKPNSEKLADVVVSAIHEKKGQKISLLDLRSLNNSLCDFFIICHGTSTTQVDAVADSVSELAQKILNDKPRSIEGRSQSEWILIDFVDVIVHVFLEEKREHYALEELWADAKIEQKELH
tara:strand:- start:1811 stop:2185 length:375 start_codon:yes stop_codon:yes gene_type:complete